jgi:hypothetical protein
VRKHADPPRTRVAEAVPKVIVGHLSAEAETAVFQLSGAARTFASSLTGSRFPNPQTLE